MTTHGPVDAGYGEGILGPFWGKRSPVAFKSRNSAFTLPLTCVILAKVFSFLVSDSPCINENNSPCLFQ